MLLTLLFDSIVKNSREVLYSAYSYNDHGLAKERIKIRLAALLHDIGHSPFSHASEELFPLLPATSQSHQVSDSHFKHEDYTYALIEGDLREAIEDHPSNKNYQISADDVTNILANRPEAEHSLFWKDLLAHQLDADRMDYLLRDSHHLGVSYGKYDLPRLASSICAFENKAQGGINIGVLSGGFHAAESLIIARYSMFKQVYLHKTRMAYDIHLHHAMSELLGGYFPPPDQDGLKEYIKWDDWRVWALLQQGKGGTHGKRILERNHFRQVYRSKDRVQDFEGRLGGERKKAELLKEALEVGGIPAELKSSKNSWYKLKGGSDISVVNESDRQDVLPLSGYSAIASLNTDDQYFLYVDKEDVEKSRRLIKEIAAKVATQLPMSFDSQTVESESGSSSEVKKQPLAFKSELPPQLTMLKVNETNS